MTNKIINNIVIEITAAKMSLEKILELLEELDQKIDKVANDRRK